MGCLEREGMLFWEGEGVCFEATYCATTASPNYKRCLNRTVHGHSPGNSKGLTPEERSF